MLAIEFIVSCYLALFFLKKKTLKPALKRGRADVFFYIFV